MTISDINDLKKIREIKTKHGFDTTTLFNLEKVILDKIDQPKNTIDKRLRGLEMEDEFLLLLLMVANIEQVTRLEQKRYTNSKKYTTPDFLLSVPVPKEISDDKNPQVQRMFVEVKKCKDNESEFNITLKAYNKYKNFAELYSLPLYFAIKFNSDYCKQWFLIPSEVMEKFSIKTKKVIYGREQDCFSIDITEILKKDFFGLWLNNHTILLKKGTVITRTYDKSAVRSNIFANNIGTLIKHKIEYNNKTVERDLLRKEGFLESFIFSTILRQLSHGKKKTKKDKDVTTIIFMADNNYFISYYNIILESYLYLRPQFKEKFKETDDTPEFYINNFSDFDKSLMAHIKNVYYELVNTNIIQPCTFMPSLD